MIASFPAINYQDPNFNVAIPVFSIHGNHDDPQGTGPEGALCALDVLSVSGLINYMGKFDLPLSNAAAPQTEADTGIQIRPVLLKKGTTKLGLYGVGNVKDSRMHYELRSNRVRMYMPKDKERWFNILLIHQNRYSDRVLSVGYTNTPSASTMVLKNLFQKACLMTTLIWSYGAMSMIAALNLNP